MGGPKLLHVLRTTQCCNSPDYSNSTSCCDQPFKRYNVTVSDEQWMQASLPACSGGLGARSACILASSAFLTSGAGTQPLHTLILRRRQVEEKDISQSSNHWHPFPIHMKPSLLEKINKIYSKLQSPPILIIYCSAPKVSHVTCPSCRARLYLQQPPTIAVTGFTQWQSHHTVCV